MKREEAENYIKQIRNNKFNIRVGRSGDFGGYPGRILCEEFKDIQSAKDFIKNHARNTHYGHDRFYEIGVNVKYASPPHVVNGFHVLWEGVITG